MINPLTEYERKLVIDAEVLLAKNKIIQKVVQLFAGLSENYKEALKANHTLINIASDVKISKGENYKGLPYLVLDYPRRFGKVDVLAIRTFFWWGNFFSITLHLSGEYQEAHFTAIEKAILKGLLDGWSLGVGDNAWQHHFETDNYTLIESGKDYNLSGYPFIKIAKKIPLDKWDDVEAFFEENFIFLIKVIGS